MSVLQTVQGPWGQITGEVALHLPSSNGKRHFNHDCD